MVIQTVQPPAVALARMGRGQTFTSALNHAFAWTQMLPRPPQVSRDISHVAQQYPPLASYRQGLAEQLGRWVLEPISCEEGGRYQCSSPKNNQI